MDNYILEYEFVGEAIERYENTITKLLSDWLKIENGLDVLVSSFVCNEYGLITIDCFFNKESVEKAKELSVQLFERLLIGNYNLITN